MQHQFEPVAIEDGAYTKDKFLDGQILMLQPAKGRHRTGLDAVYLAASLPEGTKGHVVDLGTGVGTAAFCAAHRLPDITCTGVDMDDVVLTLAGKSLEQPENSHFKDRVKLMKADITAKGQLRHSQGLVPKMADHVIMNPPYYSNTRFTVTPQGARATAHALDDRGVEPWIRTAKDILKPNGTLSVIFRSEDMMPLLKAMEGRFGSIDIIPLYPAPGLPSNRVIVRGICDSKGPVRLLPGFDIHCERGGEFTEHAKGILRTGLGLTVPAR
ncbi:SAM-dependent methyltransferase [Rhodobacteraceae bacterium RKSG542]|uniref:tRNA1(Val) (adenine(37)-N6)-methyltransferase n=1 Tax=Pseudovibrio flavus TaxID=2529854 RepID=UPI0012BCBBD2|nr:methyltransferase [Pseudovibrio flavus]MTI19336.1 SAM-dependent methyltransferase [Pseudovibrio flavus]